MISLGFFALLLTLLLVYFKTPVNSFKLAQGLKSHQKDVLKKYFPYYSKLNFAHKLQFERRLNYFLTNKEFIPREMETVTEEMKILIGACAVQLTFGFKPLKLAHFEKIMLFPSRYYSNLTKKTHKGEVNSNGMIVLSWEDFLKGYKIPDDGYNLGLHEMAHAMRLEDLMDDEEYAFIDGEDLQRWHEVSKKEYHKIRRGEKSFLRSYAGSNHNEFFSVCIEQFFEQPEEFNKELPLLYDALKKLLRQNPLNLNDSIKLV